MSLYHEAVSVLQAAETEKSSLKTQVFSKKGWKSDLKTLYALTAETAKWSSILSEVVTNSRVLQVEKQLSPTLALVLTHDLLLAKKGIALPAKHGLHAAMARNKARLNAELTKTRLKRGCANIDQLRQQLDQVDSGDAINDNEDASRLLVRRHVRWVRVNAIKSSIEAQLQTTFAEFREIEKLSEVARLCAEKGKSAKFVHRDVHIDNLLAIPATMNILSTRAYKTGEIILQDKASCFPAYLLDLASLQGDILDSCAAPGNKTTHLAAILSAIEPSSERKSRRVIACEKDSNRSETLRKMVRIAGGEKVIAIKPQQDFMKLDPRAAEFANVTGLLLDPSCSGSGIVGRDDGRVTVHLPSMQDIQNKVGSKKRKRGDKSTASTIETVDAGQDRPKEPDDRVQGEEEEEPEEISDATKLQERLAALSSFQLRLLLRAMEFPAAQRITYSTCSIHAEENEHVVVKALQSDVAIQRGWKVLLREHQIQGMKIWSRRGWLQACSDALTNAAGSESLSASSLASDARQQRSKRQTAEKIADACIRCEKSGEDLTMGFFVAAFERDLADPDTAQSTVEEPEGASGDDEWNGFDD